MRELFSNLIFITPQFFRWRLLLVVLSSAGLALFDSVLVLTVGPMVKGLMNDTDPKLFGVVIEMQVLLLVAGGILLSKNFLFILVSRWKYSVLFSLQAYLSEEVLLRVLRTDSKETTALDPGKKASYIVNEPLQLILNVHAPGISLITELSLVFFVTISLLTVNPFETVVLFGALTVLVGGVQWGMRGWLRTSGMRRRDADGKRHEIVRAVIDSEVDIRALGWSRRIKTLYEEPNRISSYMTANKAFATEIVKNVIELAVLCGVGLLIVASRAGSVLEIAPMLAVFGAAAYRLAPSFNRMMVCGQSMRFGISSLQAIYEVLRGGSPEAKRAVRSQRPAVSELKIDLRISSLLSPTGTILVRDKAFTLSRGDVVVITGPSGIGKSSLLKALVDGDLGIQIFINGKLIEGGLGGSGLAVGMAGQRAFVLPQTLGDNVFAESNREVYSALLEKKGLEWQVLGALADHHTESIICRNTIIQNLDLPITLSTLSGGQGQRIALMRAVLVGRDIVLLDEPTSALDSASRDRFVGLLQTIAPTTIILMVTHDPEMEQIASQVLRLRAN